MAPKQIVTVTSTRPDGTTLEFQALMRIDSSIEVEYYRHGGILQKFVRQLMNQSFGTTVCNDNGGSLRMASPVFFRRFALNEASPPL